MRIENLFLENIASFKGKNRINFSEISAQSDLFAITGPTGSGKSTILTSISMALYGDHPKGLNSSDIISVGAPSGKIECEFIVKNRRYHVLWSCAVLKKNGEARKSPVITRVLSDESGPLEKTPEEIIGLNFDQFSKVVILNQGQFSQFLTSTFTARKDILEKLLEHHDLKSLSKFLKTKIQRLEKQKEDLDLLTSNIQLLGESEIKEKKAALKQAESKIQALKNEKQILEKIRKNLNEWLTATEKKLTTIQKIALEESKAKESSETLINKKAPLATERKKLSLIKGQFKEELPLLQRGIELLQGISEIEKDLEFLKEQNALNLQEAREIEDKTVSAKNKGDTLTKKINELTAKIGSRDPEYYDSLIELCFQLQSLNSDLLKGKERMTSTEELRIRIEEDGKRKKMGLEEIQSSITKITAMEGDTTEIIDSLIDQKQNSELILQKITVQKELEKLTETKISETKTKISSSETERISYQEKELILKEERKDLELKFSKLKGQIKKDRLLKELYEYHKNTGHVENECPVCESQLNEEKIKAIRDLISSDDLINLENDLKKIENQTQANEKQLIEINFLQKDLLRKVTEENTLLNELLETLKETKLALADHKENLSHLKILDDQELNKLRDLDRMKRTLELELENIRELWKSHNINLEKIKVEYNESLNSFEKTLKKWNELTEFNWSDELVLENLKDQKASSKILKDANSEIHFLEKQIQELELNKVKIFNRKGEILDKSKNLNTRLSTLKDDFIALKIPNDPQVYKDKKNQEIEILQENINKLEKEVYELDMDYEKKQTHINALKDQNNEIEKLLIFYRGEIKKDIIEYLSLNENEGEIYLYLEKVKKALEEGHHSKNIISEFSDTYLEAVLLKKKENLDLITEESIVFKTQISENEKQQEKVKRIKENQSEILSKLSRLQNLAPYILKDAFRDFALEVLEDALLERANLEIDSLADGRYSLIHGKAGKKSELIVVDNWQAQNQRKVSTLSGGETFLLSLGLALGLSDIIRGQTEVECFFIDEGFGTLDEESISQVLDCLMHMQSRGKQIGLISHVKLLTNQIPVRIELEKNNFGEASVSLN